MKKQWMFFVAAMTALSITACGSGDGIVINGTTAAEAGSDQGESDDSVSQETGVGTKIEIVTDETTTAEETAAQSQESYSQEQAAQPETTQYVPQTTAAAVSTTAAPTLSAGSAVSETTAARTYKVTDTKKTMYATASVRVRSSYSTGSSVLAGLEEGEKVEVTGESENGWMRVNYKGSVGYVSKSYLTETVPATSAQTASTGQTTERTGSGNTSGSGTNSTSSGSSSSAGSTQGSGSGTGTATAPGSAAGPSAGTGENTTSSNKTGPSVNNNSGSPSTTGSTTGPGGSSDSASGSGNTSGGTSSGGSSVTGSVTALNPSGVTIQTSDGTSYQFVWGDNTPDLEPGEKIQIFYETTGSGERRVTNYSK